MTEVNYGCQNESLFSLYQKIIIYLKIENSHKKDSSMPVLAHTTQVGNNDADDEDNENEPLLL